MELTISLRMYESVRMSEVIIATRSRDSAQPIRRCKFLSNIGHILKLSHVLTHRVNPIINGIHGTSKNKKFPKFE